MFITNSHTCISSIIEYELYLRDVFKPVSDWIGAVTHICASRPQEVNINLVFIFHSNYISNVQI
jgi:hypothetical protein